MKIDGAVALVTGGAKGLGLEIAKHLAKLGAVVSVGDLDDEALALLPDHICGYSMDVTQSNSVRGAVEAVIAENGQIDILINNAGVIFSEPFVNIMNPARMMHDYDRFKSSLTVNLDSVFIVSSAVVEKMVSGRVKGVIVNISSISAQGNEGQTAYSAAKAGVNAMTVTWAKELGRLGIRVNAIAPGFIATDSTHSALHESTIQHIVSNTPLRKLGEAQNIAQAVASVVENDFINGTILDVNGGLTI